MPFSIYLAFNINNKNLRLDHDKLTCSDLAPDIVIPNRELLELFTTLGDLNSKH